MAAAEADIGAVTPHSLRVTVVDAVAHHGAPELALMVQGNWKDGRMPAKYVRDRKATPLAYLPSLAADPRSGWRPAARKGAAGPAIPPAHGAGFEIEVDEEDDDLDYECLSEHQDAAAAPSTDMNFHGRNARGPSRLVCDRHQLAVCRSLGAAWPERGSFCARCRSHRPDVAARYAALELPA